MVEEINCKLLKAVYKDKGFLPGPVNLNVILSDGYQIKIEQIGERTITISSEIEVSGSDLYNVLLNIVRLLMVFDGKFYELKELTFAESKNDEKRLVDYANNLRNSRLAYFKSDRVYGTNLICSFEKVFKAELYSNWTELIEELDISHQMYLYSLCANNMPVDIKVAFLIELAEPLVELIKKKTGLYASLSPGERGTTLKMCLDVLITKYGLLIFKREIDVNYDAFLKTLVNSRVRIMHIKKNQKGIHLNGKESVLYIWKISLLYRHILLSLLGIDDIETKDQILKAVDSYNNWDGVLNGLLDKMKNE